MKEEAVYTDLIGQYLSGNISHEEKASLMAWIETSDANQTFFEEMVALWSAAGNYSEAPFEANWEKAWEKVDAKTETEAQSNISVNPTTARVVQMQNWRKPMSIAAAILVLITIGWWWSSTPSTPLTPMIVSTGEKEQLKHTLPDSSVVWLNENSRLEFAQNFEKRTVYLVGEAFFEVERLEERPFEIFSGNAKTRVLGTSFNVRAYPEEDLIEVTVETGTVEFSKKEAVEEKVVLTKGNTGVLKKSTDEVVKETKAFRNVLTWKTEEYQFDNFNDVLLSMKRYFKVDIAVQNPAILNCDFTNTGRLEELNLDILKELIEFQTNNSIQLIKQNEGYLLKGEGCN